MARNLLYHIYPAAGSNWLWNLRLMIARLHHFDRVIVGVAEEPGGVPASTISYHLRDYKDIEFVIARNNPKLGELTTMPVMLEMVNSDRSDDFTFYAHAKGVSHTGPKLEAVQSWTVAMWDLNFRTNFVNSLLEYHACVGAFQRGGAEDKGTIYNTYGWHYSGNFWWVKHSELFCLDWRRYLRARQRHAAENFLGYLFPIEKAACVGPRGPYPLYSPRAWDAPNGVIYRAMRASDGP